MPKPPSTRLIMPSPRPFIAGLALALFGGIMIATRTTQVRDLGWALLVIGGAAALWWTAEARRVLQFRRALEKEDRRKAALNVSRRQKEEEERARREADKTSREEHAALLREQRADEGRKRKEAEDAAAKERADRQVRSAAEIARLKSLDEKALLSELMDWMRSKGFEQSETGEPDAIVFESRNNARRAVLKVVSGRSAHGADVRAVEALRRDTGSAEAYLVSLPGFATNAVRAAQGLPVTLVEAHLLAERSEQPAG
jgi:hypothetical protein